MNDPQARAMKLNALKDRIARDEYAVDVDAVADALIRRMGGPPALNPLAGVSRNGARSRAPRGPRRPS